MDIDVSPRAIGASDLFRYARLEDVGYDAAVEDVAAERAERLAGAVPATSPQRVRAQQVGSSGLDLNALRELLGPAPAARVPAIPERPTYDAPLSPAQWARMFAPELMGKGVWPAGTNARLESGYQGYVRQQTAQQQMRGQGYRDELAGGNLAMRGAELDFARQRAREQRAWNILKLQRELARPENQVKWRSLEEFAANEIARGNFDHRGVQAFLQIKGVAGPAVPTAKERLNRMQADAAAAAVEEVKQGRPGRATEAYLMLKDPAGFAGRGDGAKETLLPPALAEIRRGKPGAAVDAYLIAAAPAAYMRGQEAPGSLMPPTRLQEDIFGILGLGGGLASKRARDPVRGWLEAYNALQQRVPFLDARQEAAVNQWLSQNAPTPEQIVEQGPRFRGADGKKHGGGPLSEEDVHRALNGLQELRQRARRP